MIFRVKLVSELDFIAPHFLVFLVDVLCVLFIYYIKMKGCVKQSVCQEKQSVLGFSASTLYLD